MAASKACAKSLVDFTNAGNENPMLNVVILGHLFPYLTFGNLQNCRLVCKLWHKESRKSFLEKAPLLALAQEEYENDPDWDANERRMELNQLPRINQKTNFKWDAVQHYKRIQLFQYHFSRRWIEKDRFWKIVGESVTFLKLYQCSWGLPEAFCRLISCEATPNLEMLVLSHCYPADAFSRTSCQVAAISRQTPSVKSLMVEYDSELHNLPTRWINVFHAFPNLESFTLSCVGQEELARIFDGLTEALASGYKISLKLLNFENVGGSIVSEFPAPLLGFLQKDQFRKLALECMVISVAHPNDMEHLKDVLKFLNGIQKLSLQGGFVTMRLSFPKMSKLTKLHVGFPFDSTFFLKQCANLKTFEVDVNQPHDYFEQLPLFIRNNDRSWDEGDKLMLNLQNLETFRCNFVVNYNESDTLWLSVWFPKLSVIDMHMNDITFRTICQHFPQITSLSIRCSLVSDEGILGDDIPPSIVNWYNPSRRRQHASILNLKNLRQMEVHACSHQNSSFYGRAPTVLTHLATEYGFVKSRSLKEIFVSARTITAEGLFLLKKVFGKSFNTDI